MVKEVSILGSTGTIGKNTLDVISQHKEKFKINALTSNSNVSLLVSQAQEFGAEHVAIADERKYEELKAALPNCKVSTGEDAICEIAKLNSDIVISAIVGFAALKPTMEAIKTGAQIGLANKESLVCAGQIMIDSAKNHNAKIIPIDSEHNAIYQLFDFDNASSVEKVILTASGGPFRELPLDELADVTVEQAVKHPNWTMGKKISVDSATMMNKGLELIEAYHLFPININQLEAVIHPESYIHSFVHYEDGSVLAQASVPDMRVPISYALGFPDRIKNNAQKLDLTELGKLHFEKPDYERYPCLKIAMDVMKQGGSAPVILNAANEIAVESFLNGEIKFTQIAETVDSILNNMVNSNISSLDDVFSIDIETRKATEKKLAA